MEQSFAHKRKHEHIRIDCVESEIMELFNEYNWVTIDSVTHNGEPIDFEYFMSDFTVFL